LEVIWERWVSGVFRTFAADFKMKASQIFVSQTSLAFDFIAPNIMPKSKVFFDFCLKTISRLTK